MATAEELLFGTDYLTVDQSLRTIVIPSSVKNIGVENDDDVLRLPFKMPRWYGDIDLSKFQARINYINANNEGDRYDITDAEVGDDEITFSWLVGRHAVISKGSVKFNICLKLFNEEGTEVVKEFNTTHITLQVLEGLETDVAEVVEIHYPDILEQLGNRVSALEKNGGSSGVGQKTEDNGEIFNNYNANKATGNHAHAEGDATEAEGDASHAEGCLSKATGYVSHAEGYKSEATQGSAHAEGCECKAMNESSHAEGQWTEASGYVSHSEGLGTKATGSIQHVQGKYNIPDDTMAHIVGNGGSDGERSNIHTLDWDGNAWFAGDVTVGENRDRLVTEGDLAESFNDFIVTVIPQEPQLVSFKVSHTFAEIMNAVNSGKTVKCICYLSDPAVDGAKQILAPLTVVRDSEIIFSGTVLRQINIEYVEYIQLRINSNDDVSAEVHFLIDDRLLLQRTARTISLCDFVPTYQDLPSQGMAEHGEAHVIINTSSDSIPVPEIFSVSEIYGLPNEQTGFVAEIPITVNEHELIDAISACPTVRLIGKTGNPYTLPVIFNGQPGYDESNIQYNNGFVYLTVLPDFDDYESFYQLLVNDAAGEKACVQLAERYTIPYEPVKHKNFAGDLAIYDGENWRIFTSSNTVRSLLDRIEALENALENA